MPPKFAFDNPDDATAALADRLQALPLRENIDADDCSGRVLAKEIIADRDSPAADVSAMDGYAIRMEDLARTEAIPISAESAPGNPPPGMQAGAVVRIFTGAVIPADCEAVIMREDTEEFDGAIRFRPSALKATRGDHIRRAGENAAAGSGVVAAGTLVTAASRATMANFGCDRAQVYAPVRVCLITTGDEVGLFEQETPAPWQLRNSNRGSLAALLNPVPWITIHHIDHCPDDRPALTGLLAERLEQSDAVLLTGGVSMGDYDYVPEVVQELGGDIVFHGLPIRPGKPILGAATAAGKLILGLPGNPVSATIGCRRFAIPLLAKQSGQTDWNPPCPVVRLEHAGNRTLPLHWLRLVRLTEHGVAEVVISHGSGDLVSLAHSTGFVQVPPGQRDQSAWPYYAW
jgi:molybdenum cofactor synthesis domain-containing protein